MVIVVLRFPPYFSFFQVLTSGPDAAQHISRILFLWSTPVWCLQKAWCHGRTFASIMASTLFVQSSATRMKPKIAATGATSLLFVKLFSVHKKHGLKTAAKKLWMYPRFQHYKEHDDSQPLLVPSAWLCTGGGAICFCFFFRETPATSMTANQSQLVPNTCCFKFFSLCFFVVAQIALVSDIWSSSCSSYWSFVWLIHSLSSSHPTCPPQLQPDADQITLYEVICQCSQPCSGWWCSTKIMWQGFC